MQSKRHREVLTQAVHKTIPQLNISIYLNLLGFTAQKPKVYKTLRRSYSLPKDVK